MHRRIGDSRPADVPSRLREEPRGGLQRVRLEVLCARLDHLLDAPLRVERDGEGHTVWLFERIGYRVSRAQRRVQALNLVGGRALPMAWVVELLAPLSSPEWLPPVIRSLGLSDFGLQGHLFRDDEAIRRDERWLAEAAWRRLRHDPRFHRLRRALLPQALGLDPALVRIALATRGARGFVHLASDRYSLVWRHEALFRRVASESPRLLPLVYAAVLEQKIDPGGDAVAQLCRHFGAAGLQPAAWRYLCRHGTRFLRQPWRDAKKGRLVDAATQVLGALQEAGLPPPPTARELRLWRPFGRGVPAPVLRAFLVEAARARGTPAHAQFRQDSWLVMSWARQVQPQLDKLQRRAGWPWLLREAQRWERDCILLRWHGDRRWDFPLREFDDGHLCARAILSIRELVTEAHAFHNCLAELAPRCVATSARLWVIRRGDTGQRVAVAHLEWIAQASQWVLAQVRGPANRNPGFGAGVLAVQLMSAHHAQGVPPPVLEPKEDLRELLAELEDDSSHIGNLVLE